MPKRLLPWNLLVVGSVSAGFVFAQEAASPAPASPQSPQSGSESQSLKRRPAPVPPQEQATQPEESGGFKKVEPADAGKSPDKSPHFEVAPGTKIPLSVINNVSTKHAAGGDRVYLETVFPITVNSKIVIPSGTWVTGTLTEVKRPGRVKGRGQMFLRFDSLTLPNGITRDFRASMGGFDGRASEEVNRTEGQIKSEGDKKGDVIEVANTTMAGTGIGALAGAAAGNFGMGMGIGAAAGAAAGLVGVLLSRGPDAMLTKGTTLEMVLSQPLTFSEADLDFSKALLRPMIDTGNGPQPSQRREGLRRGVFGLPL